MVHQVCIVTKKESSNGISVYKDSFLGKENKMENRKRMNE